MRSRVAELIKEKMDEIDENERSDDELRREVESIGAFDILKGIKCIEITSGESRGCNPNVLYLTLCWDDGGEEFRYGSSLWKPIRRGDTSLGDQILNILISAYAVRIAQRIAHGKYL